MREKKEYDVIQNTDDKAVTTLNKQTDKWVGRWIKTLILFRAAGKRKESVLATDINMEGKRTEMLKLTDCSLQEG